MAFYKRLFKKVRRMREGLGFIKEHFPAGVRRIKRGIKYHLEGGKYGKQMERRGRATPEGRAMQESLKIKGFWKTLREYRRYRK